MKKNKIHKSGFTSIELILVVGILSVMSAVVYFLYTNANDKRMVSAEIVGLNNLLSKLQNATTASNYAGITNQKLLDYGIYYQSEFNDFKVEGLSPTSFQVVYKALTARQCNDLAFKTLTIKGDYSVERKINGQNINSGISDVVDKCNNDTNDLEVVFSGLNVQNIVSVTPGTPKPPPVYAGEGAWELDFPDRGDVPTNLGNSGKNVGNPNKPTPGKYIPPTYVVAGTPTPGGGATNPGSFVRPEYIPNNPLGPLVNPPDSGNEWVPAVPPVPPRPPALPSMYNYQTKPIKTYTWNTYGYGSGSSEAFNRMVQSTTLSLPWENFTLIYNPAASRARNVLELHSNWGQLRLCNTVSYDKDFKIFTAVGDTGGFGGNAPTPEQLKNIYDFFTKVGYISCIEFGDDGGA